MGKRKSCLKTRPYYCIIMIILVLLLTPGYMMTGEIKTKASPIFESTNLNDMIVDFKTYNGSNWTDSIAQPVGSTLQFRLNLTGAIGQYLTVTVMLPKMLSFNNNASPYPHEISENEYGGQNLYWTYQTGGNNRTFYFQANITDNSTNHTIANAFLFPNKSSTDSLIVIGTSSPQANPGGPYYGLINQTIQFDGSNSTDSDENGSEITRFDWKFYANDTWHNDTGPTPTYIYDSVGNYTVTLRVYDDENYTDVNNTTVTIVGKSLQATAVAPNETYVDQPVSFNGSATGGVPPYSYLWDFGDGQTANKQHPYHTYHNPGNYSVQLTVIDQVGHTASDTCSIQVNPADTVPPTITIKHPKNGFYVANSFRVPFFKTIIFGTVDVKINTNDADSGVDYVHLYIDGSLRKNFSSPEYKWSWKNRVFGRHELYVESFDRFKNMGSEKILVWKFF